ncbi:MAG: tyrosine-type recombinase/integrase [Patescibacteria group bacterium]|nr:tyrosine-type recombinase/integrase [Patescibacteria group bacterium]MDD5490818.1 tyrosine-type recombinase/integrase [Patescibacteria group bacterium]
MKRETPTKINPSSPLAKLLGEFLDYLEIEKNRSRMTRRNYEFYLGRFLRWLELKKSRLAPEDITAENVRQYRLWLNRLAEDSGQPLKKSTQNYHLIALRSFLKYLAKRDIKTLAPEKIELAKIGERTVEFLEGSDLEKFLEAPLLIKNPDIIKKRDKAILETLFATGLRVSELSNLKIDQINLKKDEFTVRGKGDKPRVVFLSNQAKYWIKEYLDARTDPNPFLFMGHDRASAKREMKKIPKLTPRSIQRLVEKYAKVAGLTKKITPHTLRHSYATDLLMNGADIRSVQAMLGHASITTTQIYTHITNQQLREVHKAFHGRQRQKNK